MESAWIGDLEVIGMEVRIFIGFHGISFEERHSAGVTSG